MKILLYLLFSALPMAALAQIGTNGDNRSEEGRTPHVYNLTISKKEMTVGGVTTHAMTVNGSIPGPNLELEEGELAIINVKNEMDVETSVHWHGLILPNYYDGVPYMTTPPIRPGETLEYRIPINQSGTYWYHSHTMLQEQSGVFGTIVIHPRQERLEYDKELVIALGDWTSEKPHNVLRNLKRGNEWYQVKKGTAVPLGRVIRRGALGAQFKFWRDRMESADIADIYYPTFIANGQSVAEYPDFKPGERVRLRIINTAASSNFWLNFGGGHPMIVSSDGIDVQPVHKNRFLMVIAETYDVIVTIPDGMLEITATVQDGSGHSKIHLGQGKLYPADIIERPDKIEMMVDMGKMNMKMGAPSIIGSGKKRTPEFLMQKYGMHMDHMMDMDGDMDMMHKDDMPEMKSKNGSDTSMHMHDMENMQHHTDSMKSMNPEEKHMHDHTKGGMGMEMKDSSHHMSTMDHSHDSQHQDHEKHEKSMDMSPTEGHAHKHHEHGTEDMGMEMESIDPKNFDYSQRKKYFNYNFLEALEPTSLDNSLPVRDILLNLTGNMNRYVWSLNGVPLTETDKIKIKKGEATRITFNNLTMMHHPMHLHGHYFRVINAHGEKSPLKHTVNVPPMEKVVIEFVNEEDGDWFLHCHVLYHMMAGMARVMSYDTPRDPRMKNYPFKTIMKENNPYFNWALLRMGSNFSEVRLVSSNIRNEFELRAEGDYQQNLEMEISYNRYLNDWVRLYVAWNGENKNPDSYDTFSHVGILGIKYFTPYMFGLDLSIDHLLRPRTRLDRELLLFPRFFIEGELEYRMDLGLISEGQGSMTESSEWQWLLGGSYILSRNFSIQACYSNKYSWGGGLFWRI